MSGDPARLIAHLERKNKELRVQVEFAENQIGPANMRYIAVKDQYEAHMAERHFTPVHRPSVAPLAMPGHWGVYCEACSALAEGFVWPCEAGSHAEFPPTQYLVVPE